MNISDTASLRFSELPLHDDLKKRHCQVNFLELLKPA